MTQGESKNALMTSTNPSRAITQCLIEPNRRLPSRMSFKHNLTKPSLPSTNLHPRHQSPTNSLPPPRRQNHQPMNRRPRRPLLTPHRQRHTSNRLISRPRHPHPVRIPPPMMAELSHKVVL